MASSTSTDLKLELITTGEKSGTWGTITNTNLQILEQAASGYLSLAVGGADVALSLATHATARSSSNYTLTVKTVSGTGLALPVGSTTVLYSDGTNITGKLQTKGYYTPPSTYTAVNGDQLLINTSGSGIGTAVTINLPTSPAIGNEVTFIDSGNAFASNNLTIGRNSSNILGNASDLVVSTNGAAFTLVYVNATRGWAYKDNI